MRIGIHTGKKIIGGIIGTDVVRYDIYGKDVMIANKIESCGEAGKVMISQNTKKWIERIKDHDYMIEFAKEIKIKDGVNAI